MSLEIEEWTGSEAVLPWRLRRHDFDSAVSGARDLLPLSPDTPSPRSRLGPLNSSGETRPATGQALAQASTPRLNLFQANFGLDFGEHFIGSA